MTSKSQLALSEAPLLTPHPDERIAAATHLVGKLLDVLGIDCENAPHLRDTPSRVARMLVRETLRGMYREPPDITTFDNAIDYSGLILTGPIEVRSTCAHHLMPIYGEAYIGVCPAPNGTLFGLSKYDRVVDYFAGRLQMQEELTKQIAQFIAAEGKPLGVAVRITAVHMCKTHRGVLGSRAGRMVTTSFHGAFADDMSLRQQFLLECTTLSARKEN